MTFLAFRHFMYFFVQYPYHAIIAAEDLTKSFTTIGSIPWMAPEAMIWVISMIYYTLIHCYTMLHYVILCYTMVLYYVISCRYTILSYYVVILYYYTILLYYVVIIIPCCCAMLCYRILCYTMLYYLIHALFQIVISYISLLHNAKVFFQDFQESRQSCGCLFASRVHLLYLCALEW